MKRQPDAKDAATSDLALQFDPAAPRGTRPSAYDIAVQRDGELDVAVPRHLEVDGSLFEIGCDPQAIDVARRQRLVGVAPERPLRLTPAFRPAPAVSAASIPTPSAAA